MSRVLRRPQAEIDLVEIWGYIAEESPMAADAVLDSINEKCCKLSESPFMGRARDELLPGMRSFPVGNYIIFYEPIEGGVDVVRVLHGARDIQAVYLEKK